MMFDRIKVWERQIVNGDVLIDLLNQLKTGERTALYLKIDEGPDLTCLTMDNSMFIDYLNNFCKNNNIDRNKIKIETDNLIQPSCWPNHITFFNVLPFLHGQRLNFVPSKMIKKHLGFFVCNSRWPRLLLGSHIYAKHREQTYLTYHQKHLVNGIENTLNVKSFLDACPLYLDDASNVVVQEDGYINWDRAYDLLPFYNHIFVDMVCETWHEGRTFMPTEKTARSIVSKTPFIIYGPIGYLENLKKLGFKTFDTIIDESYDRYEGQERIEKIKIILDSVCNKSFYELTQLYQSVESTLEHNLNVYLSLNEQTILKTFI